ncbi:uncharacterized protein LOC107043585 [Diachasma alloeum]|uniref:uncharacterized protein LOC107043585 n=1 Tax=Diachasma alloeum TaxID=454923 RepID=UPI0007381669|nr:uncharacterized protein LOC107043585 [Diachasma alloeum]
MEFFGKLMRLFGVGKPNMDPIANLPVEVAQCIFRQLDSRSLLNAARVSRGWHSVCRGDSRLRAAARRHLRREKRLAYDLFRPVRMVRSVVRPAQKVSAASGPIVFMYGPADVFRGYTQPQNVRGNLGPRVKLEVKRSMLKFR